MIRENPYFDAYERIANFKNETNYEMTHFSDRIVEFPWTFELLNVGTNPITGNEIVKLEFREGEIIEDGTDLSEKNLGNLDVHIAILYQWIKYLRDENLANKLKNEGLELTTLNGMIANAYVVTFENLEGINIIKGFYDEQKGEVWG